MENNPYHFYEQINEDYLEPKRPYTPLYNEEADNAQQKGAIHKKPALPQRNKKGIQANISQVSSLKPFRWTIQFKGKYGHFYLCFFMIVKELRGILGCHFLQVDTRSILETMYDCSFTEIHSFPKEMQAPSPNPLVTVHL